MKCYKRIQYFGHTHELQWSTAKMVPIVCNCVQLRAGSWRDRWARSSLREIQIEFLTLSCFRINPFSPPYGPQASQSVSTAGGGRTGQIND
uniref:Metallophosphoesterase n=1 Tax=Panagrellus redivivus TaxID=6233 RepID=A0A7E4VD91_PANRE